MSIQFTSSKSPLVDNWVSNYRDQYACLNTPASIINLDKEAKFLLQKKSGTPQVQQSPLNVNPSKAERNLEALVFLPESLLTQVYHNLGSVRGNLTPQITNTLSVALEERGFSAKERDALIYTLDNEPRKSKLSIEQRIKDEEAGKYGYYQGKIIDRPSYFRMRERHDLNIPTLNSIATLHRAHAPTGEHYSLFDVGAWDGGLAASLKHLYDSFDLLEPDSDRFDQLETRAEHLQRDRGFHGKSLLVNPIQARIDEYLELHLNEAQRGYDSILLSHVLYFLPFEVGETVLKNLSSQLRTGGILITVLNSFDDEPGSRAHLRSWVGVREQHVPPHYIERFLDNNGLEVVNLQKELRFACSTETGKLALQDILSFLVPGKARLEAGLVQDYIERHCKNPLGSSYEFSHKVNFLVAIQPKGSERNAFASLFNSTPLYQAHETPLAEATIDFASLMARLAIGSSGANTGSLVTQVADGPQQALELLESQSPFSIGTFTPEQRITFAALLYQQQRPTYGTDLLARDHSELTRNLRLACALALSSVDFESSEMKSQFEGLIGRSLNWRIDSELNFNWRELALSRLSPHTIRSLQEELESVVHDTVMNSDNSVLSIDWNSDWSVLAKGQPNFEIQDFGRNAEYFKLFHDSREQLTEALLSLWPVQRSIFRIILAPAESNPALNVKESTNEGMWFKETQAQWHLVADQVREISRRTRYHLNSWTRNQEDQSSYAAFKLQLAANQTFLKNINIPIGHYLVQTERFEHNIVQLRQKNACEVSVAKQKALLQNYGLPLEEILPNLEKIAALRAKGAIDKALIMEENLPLTIGFVNRNFSRFGPQAREEFIQEGQVGMSRAVDLFDLSRGVQFGTYATWWVRQAISRYISNGGLNLSRIPVHYQEYREQLKKLPQLLQRKPTQDEEIDYLMQQNDFDIKRAIKTHDILKLRFVSSDKPIGEDGDNTLGDIRLFTSPHEQREKLERQAEIRSILAPALDTLDSRERLVVSLRFGLAYGDDSEGIREFFTRDQSDDGRTLEAAAGLLGITRERVRQIESAAFEKLRESSAQSVVRLRQYVGGHIDIVKLPKGESIQTRPVSDLGLDVRTINALSRGEIHTVADLIDATEMDLLEIPNLGEATIQVIREKLRGEGLDLNRQDETEAISND